MRGFFIAPQKNIYYRSLSCVIVFVLTLSLIFSPTASYAQSINFLNLPIPGTMIAPSPAFAPILLKGMTIHPDDPLKFDFIIDSGNTYFTIDEMKGGTFTISNGVVFGSMLSTPILNPPQSAILGMHNIVERPIAVNGKVEIHPVMYLALSYDHRMIDGREAVTFLKRIVECIESPKRLLLEV